MRQLLHNVARFISFIDLKKDTTEWFIFSYTVMCQSWFYSRKLWLRFSPVHADSRVLFWSSPCRFVFLHSRAIAWLSFTIMRLSDQFMRPTKKIWRTTATCIPSDSKMVTALLRYSMKNVNTCIARVHSADNHIIESDRMLHIVIIHWNFTVGCTNWSIKRIMENDCFKVGNVNS